MAEFDGIRRFPEKTRTVLAFIPKPAAVLDRGGRILYINPAFEKEFHAVFSKSLGAELHEVLPGPMAETFKDKHRLLKKDPVSRFFVLNDGMKSYRATLSPVLFKGRYAGSILMLLDISSESVMQRLNKDAVMSLLDELNYPLQEMRSLFAWKPGDDSETSGLKHKASRLLSEMTDDYNDLVDISSLIFEHEVIHKSTFSPHKILSLALRSLRPRAEEQGIYLEELSREDLPDVIGDQAKLSRIIILLADYFLRQVPRGELICISAELDRSAQAHRLLCSVTGTGIVKFGLEKSDGVEADQERLSSELRRDKISSRRLLLMRRLVLSMNGGWASAAHEAIGTTITASIPVEPVPAA